MFSLLPSIKLFHWIETFSVIDECAKMVGSCTGLLIVGTSTFLSKPIHDYTGEEFCMIVNSISVFGITYGIYGGTGIALMRFIFIKGPSKINEKIGKRNCAKLISLATLVMTIGSLYVWINWSRMQDKENQSVCLPLLNWYACNKRLSPKVLRSLAMV